MTNALWVLLGFVICFTLILIIDLCIRWLKQKRKYKAFCHQIDKL